MEYRPPPPFDIQESTLWPKWKQKFTIFLKASGKHTCEDDVKIALLLHTIGDSGLDIYNTFPSDKVTKLDDVINCFDSYFLPKTNITMETFKFNSITQAEDQNIDSFITELKKQASKCGFNCENAKCKESYMEKMIKDRVILAIYDKQVQQRLIRETDMSLEKIQDYCKSIELSKQHIKLLKPEEEEVNAVRMFRCCRNCGNEHSFGNCPAYNKTCVVCQKRNHFAKMCWYNKDRGGLEKDRKSNPNQSKQKTEQEIERQEVKEKKK